MSYILYLLNNLTKKFRNTFNKFLISNNLVYDLVCNTSYILLNHFPEKFRTAIGGFFILYLNDTCSVFAFDSLELAKRIP